MDTNNRYLLQCDFDGTVTEEDVSFFLLNTNAGEGWHQLLEDYRGARISVGEFNRRAFAMISSGKKELLAQMRGFTRVRPGLKELAAYCDGHNIRFVVVSNGLEFYIRAVLEEYGLGHLEVHASENEFTPGGLKVKYLGPDGVELDTGFKESYTRHFLGQDYRIIYAGDGFSDVIPARQCFRVLATAELLEACRAENLACMPFTDLFDVIRALESLP